MSNTRYNKIIKINDSYLAVNSIVPILLAKRLKNGALLRKKILMRDLHLLTSNLLMTKLKQLFLRRTKLF